MVEPRIWHNKRCAGIGKYMLRDQKCSDIKGCRPGGVIAHNPLGRTWALASLVCVIKWGGLSTEMKYLMGFGDIKVEERSLRGRGRVDRPD